ncbi:MAG: DUF2849 domain-containing protein [Pseudomonadota bacterium]
MAKAFTPKVVTANHLLEGDVIYMDVNQKWVRDLNQAHLLEDESQADTWLAVAAAQPWQIVGAYLADAKSSPAGPVPTHFREDFRRRGPSNYAHGKIEQSKAAA